jgi:hypothetical protein
LVSCCLLTSPERSGGSKRRCGVPLCYVVQELRDGISRLVLQLMIPDARSRFPDRHASNPTPCRCRRGESVRRY